MIFCIAYMAYCTAELAKFSGIIALLTSGVVMAHYAWYSLSAQGKHGSYLVFQTIGLLMTAFIFSYLGVSYFSFASNDWSWHLIAVEFGICVVGRFGGTMGLVGLLRLLGYQSGISWKQVFFIGYAGLIRGAIAFGLVLRVDHSVTHRSVIVTTCLTPVVFTTVFLGATVGLVQKCLFAADIANDDLQSVASEASVHSEALHPNEEKEEDDAGSTKDRRRLGCCLQTWMRLDELILRPLLIYNYRRDKRQLQKDFFELYQDEGEEIQNIFNDAGKDEREDKSTNSAAVANAITNLKRKRTLGKAEIAGDAKAAINAADDDSYRQA